LEIRLIGLTPDEDVETITLQNRAVGGGCTDLGLRRSGSKEQGGGGIGAGGAGGGKDLGGQKKNQESLHTGGKRWNI